MFERARALGDVVRLAVPGRHPLFVPADPAHIRRVLQENRPNHRRTPFHDRLKATMGEKLVTSEGELWDRQGRLLRSGLSPMPYGCPHLPACGNAAPPRA